MQDKTQINISDNLAIPEQVIQNLFDQASDTVLDMEQQLSLALASLLAKGHLLIEDLPGVGKTTLARTLARLLGLEFQRIQCTSDLLPGDILGASVFEQNSELFRFHPGPIFSQVLLVDEINRATPKTQSGLLEAMAEGQVTIDRESHILPAPFFVIATQNTLEQAGTYPLPDSELDRFLTCFSLGHPSREAEKQLLQGREREEIIRELTPVSDASQIIRMQQRVAGIHASNSIIEYVQDILQETRSNMNFRSGLSPRAGLALLKTSRSWAFLQGRDYLIPEDVQATMPYIVRHRLTLKDTLSPAEHFDKIKHILEQVPIP